MTRKPSGYEPGKGNRKFSKETTLRRIDSLETNDSNFAVKLGEKCHEILITNMHELDKVIYFPIQRSTKTRK